MNFLRKIRQHELDFFPALVMWGIAGWALFNVHSVKLDDLYWTTDDLQPFIFFWNMLLYFPALLTIWLPLRLTPLIYKLADRRRREQLAVTLLPAGQYLLRQMKTPLLWAMILIINWIALAILCAVLLSQLRDRDLITISHSHMIRLLGYLFSGMGPAPTQIVIDMLLLFSACCAITLLGLVVCFRRLCRQHSGEAVFIPAAYTFGALALTYGVLIICLYEQYFTSLDLGWFYFFFSRFYLLSMLCYITLLLVGRWRRLCGEYYRFE